MAQDLAGKYILIQVAPFFGYDRVFAQALRDRGAVVDVLPDRPFDSAVLHAVAKVGRGMLLEHTNRIYRRQLEEFGRSHYDHVLVVNGQTLSDDLLRQLRRDYPAARFTFYIWDSFENRPYAAAALRHYDAAFSFDRHAARQHDIAFRPLFFSPEFDLPPNRDAEFDLSFIGTAHSDRPAIIHHVDQRLPAEASRYWFLYLKSPWVLSYQRITNPHFRGIPSSMFSYQPLPRERVRTVFDRSRAFLDIEHDQQTGLTIRTFEALGARKKLITTNSDIINYDFYNPSNVMVIDRREPAFDFDFLTSPIEELPPELRSRYSVNGWIDEVLGEKA